jgi:hypothetical protein
LYSDQPDSARDRCTVLVLLGKINLSSNSPNRALLSRQFMSFTSASLYHRGRSMVRTIALRAVRVVAANATSPGAQPEPQVFHVIRKTLGQHPEFDPTTIVDKVVSCDWVKIAQGILQLANLIDLPRLHSNFPSAMLEYRPPPAVKGFARPENSLNGQGYILIRSFRCLAGMECAKFFGCIPS